MTELSDAQRKLLEARLGKTVGTAESPRTEPVAIPAHAVEGPLPLSAGQQALLFEYHLRSAEPVYNVTHSYRITGDFDLHRFGRAVRLVTAAHEPLHVSLGAGRRVLPIDEAVSIEFVDLDTATNSSLSDAFDDLAARVATERIDLEAGPLVRVVVCPLGVDSYGVILALHHVSCDAGSLAVFWADLATVYGGSPLPARDRGYADHSQWQRSRTTDEDVDWWIDQLGAAPQVPAMAMLRSNAEPDGYLTRHLEVATAAIDGLGSRPLPVFLAAYGAVLQHLAAVDEPAIGVAMSTRDHPSTQSMVGYFLSVLPFRLPVGDATFRSLVAEVETRLAGGMGRRHVPFGDIVRRFRAEHTGTDIDALSRTMFVFDAAHAPDLPGLEIEQTIHPNGSSVADLTLFVRPALDGWEAAIEYRGAEFSADQATMILELFDHTLTALLNTPDAEVRRVAPRSDAITDQTALGTSDLLGGAITAALTPLSERIADIAEAGPIAEAVRCGGASLSYGDLVARADALAHRLRASGVESGDRVAIVLPRSVDIVVAILGTMRAGAAYVPIDPTYPATRIELMLDASSPAVIVADAAFDPHGSALPVIGVPTRGLSSDPPADIAWRPALDDPAYVIFTSGSTGVPRGVEVTHRNLAASTMARFDVYDQRPERFLLLSSYGFDSSVAGIFWTLSAGGEIILPSDDQVGDFDELAGVIASDEVTHLLAVPTLYDALLRRSPDRLATLRVAIVAGEAAPLGLVNRHHAMAPRCQLVNEYGPTEATVWATSFDCVAPSESDDVSESVQPGAAGIDSVSIGTPVPGTFVRVADEHGRGLPQGVAGELWIGGAGVAGGYINDPEATAMKFVIDPQSGETMFRTGDLVRINQAEQLDFLGRVDNQLSIGGTRIEPEEIEAVLGSHPAVQASVALADRNNRLVALIEVDRQRAATLNSAALAKELGRLASEQLPAALMTRPIVVDELPRTVHGKIDRAAATSVLDELQTPDAPPGEEDGGPGVVPDELMAVWREVLDDASLDSEADFFESGGDSLRALELCERLEPLVRRRVGMGELIDARTPARLAVVLGLANEAQLSGPRVDLELFETLRSPTDKSAIEMRRTLVLLPPGGGNLMAYRPLVEQLDVDQPVVGFRLPGSDGRSEPVRTIDAQADRILPELLAAVPPDGGYNLLGWSTGGLLAIELAARLERLGLPVEMTAMIDTIYPGHQQEFHPAKLSKYRSLLDDGGVKSVTDHVQHRAKVRVREGSSWVRARVAERRGITNDAKANEQRLFEIAFGAAESYRPPSYDGPVTFFAASGTNPDRTVAPWSDHLPTFDLVAVEGEHAEENAVLDAERVGPIVDSVTKLLEPKSD